MKPGYGRCANGIEKRRNGAAEVSRGFTAGR